MTPPEFQSQVSRLQSQWPQAYGTERASLLYREVKDFDSAWFTRVVDRFIGECRLPPLLTEFREEIARERERIWAEEKKKHQIESERAIHQLFDGEMIGSICKTIQDRMAGNMNDGLFKSFTQGLSKLAPTACTHCEDAGLIFKTDSDGYEWVYRCFCAEGSKKPKNYRNYFSNLRGAI